MRLKSIRILAAFVLATLVSAVSAEAQAPANGAEKSVGRKGATQTTFTFNLNTQTTTEIVRNAQGIPIGSEESTTASYQGYFGTGKFLTQRLVLNFGLGLFGTGGGDPASSFDGGLRLYFSPGRAGSAYVGGGGGAVTFGSGDSSSTSGMYYGGFGYEHATSPYSTVFGEGIVEGISSSGSTTNQFRLRLGLRLLL